MTRYTGESHPVAADDVQPGDRLIHQEAPEGWLTVGGRVIVADEVLLTFEDGAMEAYPADCRLYRVAP